MLSIHLQGCGEIGNKIGNKMPSVHSILPQWVELELQVVEKSETKSPWFKLFFPNQLNWNSSTVYLVSRLWRNQKKFHLVQAFLPQSVELELFAFHLLLRRSHQSPERTPRNRKQAANPRAAHTGTEGEPASGPAWRTCIGTRLAILPEETTSDGRGRVGGSTSSSAAVLVSSLPLFCIPISLSLSTSPAAVIIFETGSSLIVRTVFFHRLLCVPESFPVFRFSSVAISTATNMSASSKFRFVLVGFDFKYLVMHQEKVLSMRNHQRSMLDSITRRISFLVGGDFDRPAKQFQVLELLPAVKGVCVQSIEHPGCVWDVKFMENGDIVTACSDGVARFWTENQDRLAENHELEAYASLLSHYKGSRKRVGGLKLEELPGLEALQNPGIVFGYGVTSCGKTNTMHMQELPNDIITSNYCFVDTRANLSLWFIFNQSYLSLMFEVKLILFIFWFWRSS
ncbi:hypothetical protein LXL04_023497 [Taraxacum kok-saghyz]